MIHFSSAAIMDLSYNWELIYEPASPGPYHRMKYNAAANAELRNAKTCLEACLADAQQYLPTLKVAQEKEHCNETSSNVDLIYEGDSKQYRLTVAHKKGNKEYMSSSDDPAIYWRYKKDPNAKWETM